MKRVYDFLKNAEVHYLATVEGDQPRVLRRARNTSLILPAVINKMAELKGISADEVEQATTENVIRLFNLPIKLQ